MMTPSAPPYEEVWSSSDNNPHEITKNTETFASYAQEGPQQPESKPGPVYEVLTNDSSSNVSYEAPSTVDDEVLQTKNAPKYEVLESPQSANDIPDRGGSRVCQIRRATDV